MMVNVYTRCTYIHTKFEAVIIDFSLSISAFSSRISLTLGSWQDSQRVHIRKTDVRPTISFDRNNTIIHKNKHIYLINNWLVDNILSPTSISECTEGFTKADICWRNGCMQTYMYRMSWINCALMWTYCICVYHEEGNNVFNDNQGRVAAVPLKSSFEYYVMVSSTQPHKCTYLQPWWF